MSLGSNVSQAELFESTDSSGHYCINMDLQSGEFISFGFDLSVGVSLYVRSADGTEESYKEVRWTS